MLNKRKVVLDLLNIRVDRLNKRGLFTVSPCSCIINISSRSCLLNCYVTNTFRCKQVIALFIIKLFQPTVYLFYSFSCYIKPSALYLAVLSTKCFEKETTS